MIKIMFVCLGNICRSPMAEFVMKELVKKQNMEDEFQLMSSATSEEEIGNPMHRGTTAKLREKGIPYSDHRAVRLTKADYERYNLIIAMEPRNITDIIGITGADKDCKVRLLLDYTDDDRKSIADPWYTGNFEGTYKDVEKGCLSLLKTITKSGEYNQSTDKTAKF